MKMYLKGEWMNMWIRKCMNIRDGTSTMARLKTWKRGKQCNR